MTASGGIDVDEVRYAPNGKVYFAPVGTAAPTDATTALSSTWYDVGYVSEDGVSITPNVDLGEIRAWQSVTRLKRTINSVDMDVAFKMMQINKTVLSKYFFGATTTMLPGGQSKMVIPSNIVPSDLEVALVIDWTDDEGSHNRFYFPHGTIGEREAMQLARTDAVMAGVTYSVNDSNGEFGELFSDNLDLYS